MTTKKPVGKGRPPRSQSPERVLIAIKLTLEENEKVEKLAEKYKGNVNKLFRVRVLGEKESK